MSKTKVKKSINDYIKKDKFMKCESFDQNSSVEIKSIVSKLSLDCISNSSGQATKLKELYSILESKIHGKSIILRKSVLVSLCLVYKDILPTYKITVLTEQQKNQNMKNDTIKSYSEEEILLSHYYKFVHLIESVLNKQYNIEALNHIKWTESDELTILKCACSLFLNNPNFNYSMILLKMIIPFLNSTNHNVLKYASKCIEKAIHDDIKLDVSLKIVEVIKKFSGDNKFNIRSTLLKPFMKVELEDLSLNDENTSKQKNSLLSRKQKKNIKKNKQFVQQIEESNAKESINTKCNLNSQIIRSIFYVYFRVLKRNNIPSKLLETVLEGVGKYGRLIDCKLFPDIFALMNKISKNSKISLQNRLRSVFVSLNIITSGKASDILDIDPGKFSDILISLGANTCMDESCVVLVINCCTKLLVKRRNHISSNDAKNVIKMLIKLAWNQKNFSHVCSTVLVSLVRYLRIYPQLQYLFDDEDENLEDINEHNVVLLSEHQTFLHELSKLPIYEISGFAKRLKKFFSKTDIDNTLFELKGNLEELARMKTEECIEFLKERLNKNTKRSHKSEENEIPNKHLKLD